MTNERAIQILENLIGINGDVIIGDEDREALEMAVRSLQQEQQENYAKRGYKDCNGCEYNRTLKDQIGWQFRGCFGGDYKGKPIAEIELCPLKVANQQEQKEVDLEDKVTFDCISKKVTMTVRELINYYIDRECCDVAEECGF